MPIHRRLSRLAIVGALLLVASSADAAKEKFERTKPHVNISTHTVSGENMVIGLEVVAPGEVALGVAPAKPCTTTVDMRIESVATGGVLESRSNVVLTPGTLETISFEEDDTERVRVVLVTRDSQIDGKECVLRGQIEFQSTGGITPVIRRSIPIRRSDFVLIRRTR